MTVAPHSMPFGRTSFCLLDLETTGFHPHQNEITEISALLVNEHYEVVDARSLLIRIDAPVPWHISQLTGITNAMLRSKGVALSKALDEIHELVRAAPAYAHNAKFDQGFLDAASEREGRSFRFALDCTIPIFKRLLPGRRKYGLGVLAEQLGVDSSGAHRGLSDCRILLACLQKACQRGIAI